MKPPETAADPLGLSAPILSGIRWSSLSTYGQHALLLLTTAALSRLLHPADFGLLSMAMVATRLPATFRDLGTGSAVIQHREPSDEMLSTLFWIHMSFAATTAALVWAAAPAVARFYGEPAVSGIVRVLSLTLLCWGPRVLQQSLLERSLQFAPLARAEFIAAVFGSAAAIGLALCGGGVWSLAAQPIVSGGVASALIWSASKWRPRLLFRWGAVREVARYSLNLTAFNAINFASRNADNVIIGRALGAEALGYYNLAYTLMLYPLMSVSVVIGRAAFPVYARMQHDIPRLRRTFLLVAETVALASFPMLLGLMALCRPFILAVFGQTWIPAVPLILILAPLGMVQSILTMNGAIYRATGRMGRQLALESGLTVLVVASFFAGLRWGIVGVTAAYAATSLILAPLSGAAAYNLLGLPLREVAFVLRRPLAAGLFMAALLLPLRHGLPASIGPLATLALLVPAGVGIYLWAARRLLGPRWDEILKLLLPRRPEAKVIK